MQVQAANAQPQAAGTPCPTQIAQLPTPTPTASPSQPVLVEYWDDVTGFTAPDWNYVTNNSRSQCLGTMLTKAQTERGDNYMTRMSTYVQIPISGNYVFYVSSDNDSILRLAMNGNPANPVQIAQVTGWNAYPEQWNEAIEQASALIPLVAGQIIYLEAVHREYNLADHLAFGWLAPSTPAVTLIPTQYLLTNRLSCTGIIPTPGPTMVPTAVPFATATPMPTNTPTPMPTLSFATNTPPAVSLTATAVASQPFLLPMRDQQNNSSVLLSDCLNRDYGYRQGGLPSTDLNVAGIERNPARTDGGWEVIAPAAGTVVLVDTNLEGQLPGIQVVIRIEMSNVPATIRQRLATDNDIPDDPVQQPDRFLDIPTTENNGSLFLAFAHLSSASVLVGDTVAGAQIIGYTGNTGSPIARTDTHLDLTIFYVSQNGDELRVRIPGNSDSFFAMYSDAVNDSGEFGTSVTIVNPVVIWPNVLTGTTCDLDGYVNLLPTPTP
jgi:hypothetical protein